MQKSGHTEVAYRNPRDEEGDPEVSLAWTAREHTYPEDVFHTGHRPLVEDSLSVVGPCRMDDHTGMVVAVEVPSSCNHHNHEDEGAAPLGNLYDPS